ncbi:Ppx/GppA family phosphatase [Rhizobiales bacterium L72]|uniref:Ppx/GppA family phosphatase n=1 Tax=Propylenella binzhouense TaxID=2555902 RepID=A0A964T5Y1_9HYPH|nr:Ppx/GppA family phosphatase [Propylenella binzhouense]
MAVVDIGSNSVRLVVYERLARSPTPLFNEKVLAGLGAGVAATGRLATDAVAKTLASLRRFAVLAREMEVVEIDVLATAATREASNGAAFLAEIERIFGVPVTVLSGADEAKVSALGVIAGVMRPDGVAGDLGGGSLELTDIRGRRIGHGESLKLGSLRLQTDARNSLKAARQIAASAIEGSEVMRSLPGRTFYAVGGTWRSLARLHMRRTGYPLHVMHEYAIEVDEFDEFLKVVARGSLETLAGISAVSKQRQALLPYGALVLSEILRVGRPKAVTISALGLREGHLYSKLTAEEQREDPLVEAARELSILRSRSPAHGEELIPWTGEALRALGVDETPEEKRLRAAACLLADIGWRAHPDYRGEQSLNIIAHASFVGVDHPGRVYLALAVYYRHSGLSEDELGSRIRELAPIRYAERARALAGAFRVAYLISAAMPGVVGRTRIHRAGKKLELVLPADLAMLAAPRLETRLKQFAALAGLNPVIRIEG